MSIYRGAIYLLSKGAWVNENEMSRDFLAFPRGEFLGLTVLSWLALARRRGVRRRAAPLRALARDLYAAGGNPEAANYSGIDAGRMQFLAYTICGAIAGVCGYLWVARFAVAYTDIALGFELSVIAACLIGGVAIAGGVGSAVGVVLGLPVHRHHPQQPAAGGHLRVLADVHQWRGDSRRGAAERAAACSSSAPSSRRAHEAGKPASLGIDAGGWC